MQYGGAERDVKMQRRADAEIIYKHTCTLLCIHAIKKSKVAFAFPFIAILLFVLGESPATG